MINAVGLVGISGVQKSLNHKSINSVTCQPLQNDCFVKSNNGVSKIPFQGRNDSFSKTLDEFNQVMGEYYNYFDEIAETGSNPDYRVTKELLEKAEIPFNKLVELMPEDKMKIMIYPYLDMASLLLNNLKIDKCQEYLKKAENIALRTKSDDLDEILEEVKVGVEQVNRFKNEDKDQFEMAVLQRQFSEEYDDLEQFTTESKIFQKGKQPTPKFNKKVDKVEETLDKMLKIKTKNNQHLLIAPLIDIAYLRGGLGKFDRAYNAIGISREIYWDMGMKDEESFNEINKAVDFINSKKADVIEKEWSFRKKLTTGKDSIKMFY